METLVSLLFRTIPHFRSTTAKFDITNRSENCPCSSIDPDETFSGVINVENVVSSCLSLS